MKIPAYQNGPTLVIGGNSEMKFSIEENGVIFDILRDKMYSNKIGSIVREVASNSRDANRENGNADIPVTIMITKQYSQILQDQYCIVFRDSGLGISPDRMANVFVKYAASTKRNTDAQTGGFGLGAKTPFAYTDSFYIHTKAINQEGEKKSYFYNALVDDSGSGKMVLLEEELTDEPTGTDIIIPLVKSDDKQKFAEEAIYYTSLWGETINLEGVSECSYKSLDPKHIIYDDELFVIVESSYSGPYGKGVYCLVDGIPYPVDTRISERITDLNRRLDSHTIFLKFNTGEISVTATREGIEYNEKTKKAIDSAFGKLLRVMMKRFSKQLNEMTYLECIAGVVSTFAKQQNLFQRSMFENTLEGKVITIINKYVEDLDILSEISYRGEKLRLIFDQYGAGSSLGIKKEFEIVSVERKEPEKYKVVEHPNLLRIRNQPVYLMDSNKDRRRNHTIFDNITDNHFFLIRPFGRKIDEPLSNTQCSMFMDMVVKFEMNLNFYSEVEKKVIEKSIWDPTIYVPGKTVQTRWRKISSGVYNEGGEPFVVDVDRTDFYYIEFKEEKDLVFTVDRLSEFSIPRDLVYLADELKIGIYIVAQKTHDMYFKSEPFTRVEKSREFITILREKRLEILCEGVDIELLKTALTIKNNLYTSLEGREIYIDNRYNRMTLINLMLLSLYSERAKIMFKTILHIEPTVELIKFMLEKRLDIERLDDYKDQLEIITKPRSRFCRKRGKVVTKIIHKIFKENILVKGTLGQSSDIELKLVDKLVRELLILKQI